MSAATIQPPASVSSTAGTERRREVIKVYARQKNVRAGAKKLLRDAAELIGETLRADHAGCGLLIENEGQILTEIRTLTFGDPETASATTAAAQPGKSAAGVTLAVRDTLIIDDLSAETRFRDTTLQKLGTKSLVAVPVLAQGNPIGVILISSSKASAFKIEDVQFAETIAHLLEGCLALSRVEAEAAEERSFLSSMLENVHDLVFVLDTKGHLQRINSAAERFGGYNLNDAGSRMFWELFCRPQHTELVQQAFRSVVSGNPSVTIETQLRDRQDQDKPVEFQFTALRSAAGETQSVIVIGQAGKTTRAEAILRSNMPADKSNSASNSSKMREEFLQEEEDDDSSFSVIPTERGQEYRASPRRAFRYSQRVALVRDGKLPAQSDFTVAEFRDISGGGASFILAEEPQCNAAIIELGHGEHVSYMAAKIVRSLPLEVQGEKLFLVGCQFVGRIGL